MRSGRQQRSAAFDYHAAAWLYGRDAVLWADADTGRILDANPQAERLFGRSRDDLVGRSSSDLHPHDLSDVARSGFTLHAQGTSEPLEIDIESADGRRVLVEIRAQIVVSGGRRRLLGSFRDLTERQMARLETARRAAALSAIHHATTAAMEADSDREFMAAICRGIIAEGKYGLAFVGVANDDAEQTITIAASSGASAGFLDDLQLVWADAPSGQGPTGRAIRLGATQLVNSSLDESGLTLWTDRMRRFDIAAMVSVPLLDDGVPHGALTIYARERDAFGDVEQRLFEDLARQLVLGIRMRRERIAYREQVEQNVLQAERIRVALEQTVGTVSATIEQRDPYTAGHSRAVADLAERIARRIGFPPERSHGVYLAGLVHDVGKIRIPAEILSKPGAVSDIEYAMLQTHSEVGYEILRGVDFPWPISEATYQHHERLDGSGYPRGLRGDDVILDARIVAVADVIDSMSTHRPYRPAHAKEHVVEALQRQRGTLLDSDVVEAALLEFG